MSLKSINEGFKRKLASLISLNESVTTDLGKALFATLRRLQSNGETNIKAYEVAFQDTIEKQFPGKSWWEVTDCQIFWSLFNGRDPELTVTEILSGLKPEYKTDAKTEGIDSVSFGGTDEMVNEAGNKEIKSWYKSEFPNDDAGDDLVDGFTFLDLFNMMDNHKFDYRYVANDSLVRERVFAELAKIMNVDYDYIYDQWLTCDESFTQNKKTEDCTKIDESTESALTEGAPNFWTMEDLPLLVFDNYDDVYDQIEQRAVERIVKEHGADYDYDSEELDDAMEKEWDEYENDIALLDEEEYNRLKMDVDDFNADCRYSDYDPDETDCPEVEIKPGYYTGAQLYCNTKYLDNAMKEKVANFFADVKKRYGLTELGVSWRASNGETAYHKIGESIDEGLTKAERHNRAMNKIFDAHDAFVQKEKDCLIRNGVSKEDVEKMAQDVGLHGDPLAMKIKELGIKCESLTEASSNEDLYFRAYITNLGKYNEGDLIGKWVDFPIDEDDFNEVLKEIGISDDPDKDGNVYEEWFVTDYECNLPGFEWNDFGEYPGYETLQNFGEKVSDVNQSGEAEAVINAYEVTGDIDEAINGVQNGRIVFYPGIGDESDLGYYMIENVYNNEIPDNLMDTYFDYDAFGRDVRLEYYQEDEGSPETAGEYWCGDENASDKEIGEAVFEELGSDGISNKDNYFDYEAFGRDLTYEGFTITSDGAIEYT